MRRHFGNALGLFASGEPRPHRFNRITLDSRVDAFGVPLPRVELRLEEEDLTFLERMRRRLSEVAAAVPGGRVVEQFCSYDRPPGGTELRGGCAEIVDRFGKVQGVGNLYIADASVFPTGGSGNPSLTIMALATRTAEHLVECFGKR
jgi:choline dehydrogenase-like flavoprotein